ncbi:MAG: helix-turn-helix transcriptional regulator [Bacteroidetes bacterium]|jgi:AraC-like DNA-binding protein|nr:helix-turn-helix transcriptional regulator [Bacteroidota bacterium]MBT4400976.1 helix-turn-helix transcriptional regulator [Bacteroidota bacterium]MBT4411648.1 helix-turn-helix transcriptional regulator [Bacteroidota bacterium]MBT7093475.1 helix-turn-helix transcriptional regulator [Bacteroidota bacterium]MBT7462410.1 helix-turn-helix transcriptional regulator [Bacteroidota bacterium]
MAQDLINTIFKQELGFSVFNYRNLECQSGYRYGDHEHDHIEINYIRKGSCYMKFDTHEVRYCEGDTMVVYPGARHYFYVDDRMGCQLVQVEFRIENLSVLEFRENSDDNLLFLFSLLQNTHRFLKVPGNKDISDNMVRLVKELEASGDPASSLVKLYFFELFIHLSRNLKIEKDLILTKPDQYVVKALQFIHNNFLEDPSVEDIAAYCGISDRYLRKMFFGQTGMQIVEYKHKLRMQMAFELLKDPDQRFTEIAYRCGYSTQQYFCKVFKDYFGKSPGEMRKEL